MCLMEFDERKRLKLMERIPCVLETSEKFEFSYLEKFSHLKNLDGMDKLEISKLNPLSYRKTQVSSHS